MHEQNKSRSSPFSTCIERAACPQIDLCEWEMKEVGGLKGCPEPVREHCGDIVGLLCGENICRFLVSGDAYETKPLSSSVQLEASTTVA